MTDSNFTKENLLEIWLSDAPPRQIADHLYFETAESNGQRLLTRPRRTMTKDAVFMPYRETDGVGYVIVDSDDQIISGPFQATFEWFLDETMPTFKERAPA